MNSLEARLKRLEASARCGWKSYAVSTKADIERIRAPEGLIFLDAPELIGPLENRLAEIGAAGKYTIIIDNIPK